MSLFNLLSTLITLLFIGSSTILKATATPSSNNQNYKTFIKTACNSTTYPTMCNKRLSPYSSLIKSDPIKLCTTALTLNIKAAIKATSTVSKLLKKAPSTEIPILNDCIEEMKDTVDELKQANVEMKKLREEGEATEVHMKNVETWVSSALTDEGTCMDGFEEEEVVNEEMKNKVKKATMELSRTTSYTLALITNYPNFLRN